MADILDVDPLSKFMCLLTGANGSGKSIALGSWKSKGSIYYFDFDGRMASVANWYKQRGLKQGQLSYDTYGPHNFMDSLRKLDEFTNRCPHAAIAIDSFTAVTVSAVVFSIKTRMGTTAKYPSLTKGGLVVPDWDEYKGETYCITQMLDMCKAIAAQGTAVFWTAHPVSSTKIEGDRYGKQTKYSCYGYKTDSLIPIYFNEIYYFNTEWDFASETNKRWCWTQPMPDANAKTALNLPNKIDWTNKDFYEEFSRLVAVGQQEVEQKMEEAKAAEPVKVSEF